MRYRKKMKKYVKKLIQRGGDIYKQNEKNGKTALHFLQEKRNERMIKILLKDNKDLEIEDNNEKK